MSSAECVEDKYFWIRVLEKGIECNGYADIVSVSKSQRSQERLTAIILMSLKYNMPIVVNDYRDIERVSELAMDISQDDELLSRVLRGKKGFARTPCILTVRSFDKCKGVSTKNGVLIDIKGYRDYIGFMDRAIANNIIVRSGFYEPDGKEKGE